MLVQVYLGNLFWYELLLAWGGGFGGGDEGQEHGRRWSCVLRLLAYILIFNCEILF